MKNNIKTIILLLCVFAIVAEFRINYVSNRDMIYASRQADKEIVFNNQKIFKLLLINDSVLSSDLNKLKIKYDSLIKLQKK